MRNNRLSINPLTPIREFSKTDAFSSTLTWGIIIGLFVGKQVGIYLATYLMKLLGLSTFPELKNAWKIVYGLAWLSGVGFTMSLFIASLSFESAETLEFSKFGIMAGSLLSGLLGYALLRNATQNSDGSSTYS
jgi:NhaA family Na+:H+ antiporter